MSRVVKRLCIRIGHYGAIQMLYYYYYYKVKTVIKPGKTRNSKFFDVVILHCAVASVI